MLGLLQAQWTYTGYDASAHVAEETVMARLNSAWGVFLSVAVSAVVGYVMLLILTLHVPDIAATVDPANAPAVLYIAYANLPPRRGASRRDHHRRRDVAVRPVVDHQHEPHVVRLRARRRHAGVHR